MDKILISVISVIATITGVIIGVFITFKAQKKQFAHDRLLQDRQFDFDRKKQDKIYKSLLETLIQEIKNNEKQLKENRGVLSEYYDVSIQNEVIKRLLDTELFYKNKRVFDDIMSSARCFSIFNGKLEDYKSFARKYPLYQPLSRSEEVKAERDILFNEVNDYIGSTLGMINFQDIVEKLENIKNSLE